MAASVLLFVVAVVTLFIWQIIKQYYDNKNFPPGLPRVPFMGCIPFLHGEVGARVLMSSVKLIPKYGDIIGYIIGPVKMVFIQDFSKAKEIAFNDKFSGRFEKSLFNSQVRGYSGKPVGIATTDGPIWKVLRRFSLSTLKEFGFGKQGMEAIIREEVDDVIDNDIIGKYTDNQEDMLIKHPFNISVFNILWRIVAGKRYKRDDPQLIYMVEMLSETFKNAFVELMFPLLFRLWPSLFKFDLKKKHIKTLKDMMEKTVDEHKINLDLGEPKDFIDVYLIEMQNHPETFTEHQLIGICMDFFEAGGETVGTTLSWTLLYFALYPHVQRKCQDEIESVIGNRPITLADKPNLPYCEATIMEVQRLSCVAPAGLEHRATEDVYFHGYVIPKDTNVYYNIYWFHTDPSYWGDPQNFRPDRFLNSDGKLERKDQFIPFGFGKRVCMGETMAKAELFLFTTAIIQKLQVNLPRNHPIPDPSNDIAGLTRAPKPFYVNIGQR